MKRFLICSLALALAALMLICFAACSGKTQIKDPNAAVKTTSDPNSGKKNDFATKDDRNKAKKVTLTVTSEECFDSEGYSALLANTDSEVTVKASGDNTDVSWSVYVLDDKFTDPFRMIPAANEPVIEGDGSFSVKKGQYIYVYCSVNSFTDDSPASGASLELSGYGLSR